MFKRLISSGLVLTIAMTQIGCSMFKPSQVNFTAMTNVPDAEIYVNGVMVGKGTVTTQVPRNQHVNVMAKREGYHPAIATVGNRLSMTAILDIIGGFLVLVPFIGLAAPGAFDLETNMVSLVLPEK